MRTKYKYYWESKINIKRYTTDRKRKLKDLDRRGAILLFVLPSSRSKSRPNVIRNIRFSVNGKKGIFFTKQTTCKEFISLCVYLRCIKECIMFFFVHIFLLNVRIYYDGRIREWNIETGRIRETKCLNIFKVCRKGERNRKRVIQKKQNKRERER